jgi:hypothetical protein
MAAPSGRYHFFFDKSTGADILDIQADTAGNLIHSTLSGDSITGSYDGATGKISFGHSGALRSSARVYVGYAILDQAGSLVPWRGLSTDLNLREPVDFPLSNSTAGGLTFRDTVRIRGLTKYLPMGS